MENGEAVDQIVVLENHAHFAAELPEILSPLTGYLLAVQPEGAAAYGNQAVDGPQEGRFSRPGGADDGDEFPLLYLKGYVFQRVYAVWIIF